MQSRMGLRSEPYGLSPRIPMLGSIPIGVTTMADNVHEGDLDLSDVTSPEELKLPDNVTGILNLGGLT